MYADDISGSLTGTWLYTEQHKAVIKWLYSFPECKNKN